MEDNPQMLAQRLSQATSLDASAIGFAAQESEEYRTYRRLRELGTTAIPEFQRLLEQGTLAARLYAIAGLVRLGRRDLAEEAVNSLGTRTEEVLHRAGCIYMQQPVAELAKWMLENPV